MKDTGLPDQRLNRRLIKIVEQALSTVPVTTFLTVPLKVLRALIFIFKLQI
ncbi:MAG: hypothetical protein F6K22_07775 [Okeania sp. SIO2F4]|nr:hypothetical protein [Okeania sp. SIO2F4]